MDDHTKIANQALGENDDAVCEAFFDGGPKRTTDSAYNFICKTVEDLGFGFTVQQEEGIISKSKLRFYREGAMAMASASLANLPFWIPL